MEWTEWMGIATTVSLGAMGLLKFMQSRKVDAVSLQSGAASNHRAGTQQVIDGLNTLLNQYRESSDDDRDVIKLMEGRLDKYALDLDACRAENVRLREKYGEK